MQPYTGHGTRQYRLSVQFYKNFVNKSFMTKELLYTYQVSVPSCETSFANMIWVPEALVTVSILFHSHLLLLKIKMVAEEAIKESGIKLYTLARLGKSLATLNKRNNVTAFETKDIGILSKMKHLVIEERNLSLGSASRTSSCSV